VLLEQAAAQIRRGGVVAIPTDTCYGLAANPFDPKALDRIFTIKGRSPLKPISIFIAHRDMLAPLISDDGPSPAAERLMETFWPGPLTLIFKSASTLPDRLTAGTQTIGVRLPASAFVRSLIEIAGIPITATSANRSGDPNPVSAREVAETLMVQLHPPDRLIDGGPGSAVASTVVDVMHAPPRLVRNGALALSELAPFGVLASA